MAFGRVYDGVGLRGLLALPLLAVAVPFLSFSNPPVLFVVGAAVWGAGMGIHDPTMRPQSPTMRAAVADFVPAHRRGAGYGTFAAIYGLAWLAGSTLIGLLYEHGTTPAAIFVIAVQAAALAMLAPLVRPFRADRSATARTRGVGP